MYKYIPMMHVYVNGATINHHPPTITLNASSGRLGNCNQVYIPAHHQQYRQDIQGELQIDMFCLLQSQNLTNNDEHNRDVGRYAHELVRTHHHNVDSYDGQLWQSVFDDFFHPDGGGDVNFLLEAFAYGCALIGCYSILFVVVLVVDWFFGDGTRLFDILEF